LRSPGSEEKPVHDLSERLISAPDASISGDIEDYGMGGDLLVYRLQKNLKLVVASSLGEAITGVNSGHDAVLDRQTQHLCKAGFAGAKEARHPDRNALMGLVRRLAKCVEYIGVVRPNGIGHYILIDLVA
jgi:hypothetical protein